MNTFSTVSIAEIEDALRDFSFFDLDKKSFNDTELKLSEMHAKNLSLQLELERNKFWQEKQETIMNFSKNNVQDNTDDNFFALAIKYIEKHTGRTIGAILKD